MIKKYLIKIVKEIKNKYLTSDFLRFLGKVFFDLPIYRFLLKKRILASIRKPTKINLLIETTNFCNAKCIMCPNQFMKREKKVMEDKVFEKIVERIEEKKSRINKIYLSGFGEPLTDEKFLTRLEKIKSLGLQVSFYTNASLLTKKVAKSLIRMGVDEVNISFNGVTSKQYRRVMQLDYRKTVRNINTFLRIRKEMAKKIPFIRISFVLIKKDRHINKYFRRWKDVDSVTVSLAHGWGIKKNQFKMLNVKYIYPCRSLWHTLVIDSSGNFVICCRDYESKHILGNVLNNSFEEILGNRLLLSFRKKHLTFEKGSLPKICLGCNFPYQNGVEWWFPRSIID